MNLFSVLALKFLLSCYCREQYVKKMVIQTRNASDSQATLRAPQCVKFNSEVELQRYRKLEQPAE